jgi:hypothetical protein
MPGSTATRPMESGPSRLRLKALPPRASHSVTRKRMPSTCLSLSLISTTAPAAPSTTGRSTMCGRFCPASRGGDRSRSLFLGSDKRQHGFAMTSDSRWCAQTTDSEAGAAPCPGRLRLPQPRRSAHCPTVSPSRRANVARRTRACGVADTSVQCSRTLCAAWPNACRAFG